MAGRFLPGVPGPEIEAIFNSAPGNEIATGKFDSPESSAALAANSLGFFLGTAPSLPVLPGYEAATWPARTLVLEAEVRLPWNGGMHPVLDCLVTMPSALIGIESKRFEPFRIGKARSISGGFWREARDENMKGFEAVRDSLDDGKRPFRHLGAVQLFKHAFALRTAVHCPDDNRGLAPKLVYLFTEPVVWPTDGSPAEKRDMARHREEVERFGTAVAGDEVAFVSCSYRRLLCNWMNHDEETIRSHPNSVAERFSPW